MTRAVNARSFGNVFLTTSFNTVLCNAEPWVAVKRAVQITCAYLNILCYCAYAKRLFVVVFRPCARRAYDKFRRRFCTEETGRRELVASYKSVYFNFFVLQSPNDLTYFLALGLSRQHLIGVFG